MTPNRLAIARLIRHFRANGCKVAKVGQYPRHGFSYLCSGFEYQRRA